MIRAVRQIRELRSTRHIYKKWHILASDMMANHVTSEMAPLNNRIIEC